MNDHPAISKQPTLFKLAASLLYDTLVVIALSLLLSLLFIMLLGDATQGVKRVALQLFIWFSVGIYFVWCWSRSGQTLAMHTWRLKLTDENGDSPVLLVLCLRYLLASIGLMLVGLGFFWAVLDRDKCYLHDRILKTRIIFQPKS